MRICEDKRTNASTTRVEAQYEQIRGTGDVSYGVTVRAVQRVLSFQGAISSRAFRAEIENGRPCDLLIEARGGP